VPYGRRRREITFRCNTMSRKKLLPKLRKQKKGRPRKTSEGENDFGQNGSGVNDKAVFLRRRKGGRLFPKKKNTNHETK